MIKLLVTQITKVKITQKPKIRICCFVLEFLNDNS